MAQSLRQLLVHLVFSTKDRRPYLKPTIANQVHNYMARTIRDVGSDLVVVGGIADHVHLFFNTHVGIAPVKYISQVKRESSKFVKTLGREYREFAWQSGYGLFSVSSSQRESVEAYILNQAHHHRRMSFQDEFRAMLKKQRIDFDERYLWD